MKMIFPGISGYGLGTTGFWSGSNPGLDNCIREAVEQYDLTVLDTAEMYGDGRSEEALGKSVRGLDRERIFLVDKILPQNATPEHFRKSLHSSLKRLQTDYLDLYLLHWREETDLTFLVKAMEDAVEEGLIRRWGVSNFDTADLEDLLAVKNGNRCFCNQIFYNVYERGAEHHLLPFMQAHAILPMAYSSLGSDYHPHPDIHRNRAVSQFCGKTGIAPEAFMLRWNLEHGFCACFSTSSPQHLRDNLCDIPAELQAEFSRIIELEFPCPKQPSPLVKL